MNTDSPDGAEHGKSDRELEDNSNEPEGVQLQVSSAARIYVRAVFCAAVGGELLEKSLCYGNYLSG